MEQFPHLNFVQKITGKPRLFGGGSPNPTSESNRQNRQSHSTLLSQRTSQIKSNWINSVSQREEQGLAPLDESVIPIFLQINPDLINSEFDLESLGIEIISEEDEGFIIGASLDAFQSLTEKIRGFALERFGTGRIADLWQIVEGNRETWRPQHILSEELLEKWATIDDNRQYKLEVGIAFDKPLGKEPDPTKMGGQRRLERFRQRQRERDELLMGRESHFEAFISNYGTVTSGLIHLEDCFACEIEISGRGLKDLVFNYPFVFDVAEAEEIEDISGADSANPQVEFEILPPDEDAPEIGVIDSGIMEDHRYLRASIRSAFSRSYIDGENSTADQVRGGGHGTKVAGAVLYPYGVSNLQSPYKLPFFIRNLRVLDGDNALVTKFPALLMKQIVDENGECKIFNLSLCSKATFRKKHMSAWAATIDSIIYEKDVLFVISAGNIHKDIIRVFINQNSNYPAFLQRPYSRLANPAQSSFALTVGSINHSQFEDANWRSLGGEREVSAFSRIGLGMWGQVKPDVVEFGGGLVVSKDRINTIRSTEHTCPELIRSTLHGGGAYGKDSVGTSFAAPKVSHIVGHLKKLYPNENINLLRALTVQGARLPNQYFVNPTFESLQHYGYGLPSLERVTANTQHRISFYNTGNIKAEEGNIYSLKVPSELRNQANDYDVLIEVTLAFTAKVRRTRQKTKSYLSTWLDWTTSKMDEPFDDFKEYVLKEIEDTATAYDQEFRRRLDDYPWKIRERSNWGEISNVNRNNSTVQKDWAIIKSYQLPEEISFAVRAHKGWDKSMEEIPYALVVSIELLNADVPIYESIRVENEIEIQI